jgi:choline dehydrogenase-like flavoprotein
MPTDRQPQYEFVVVGSGAGGGTLAARLAEYGFKVLLLEAGGDPRKLRGGDAPYPDDPNRLPDDYDVPVFHAISSENKAMKWDFFVKHYSDPKLAARDPKYIPEQGGVLYPRGGTLGGCTSHNAMITIYPHNDDWRDIEKMWGDSSWSPKNMRKYFERMENCHHRFFWRWLYNLLRINPTRHGWRGWFNTEKAIPKAALDDKSIVRVVLDSFWASLAAMGAPLLERLKWLCLGTGDPNDWRLVEENSTGLRYPPLSTNNHVRNGSRERVLDVMQKHPDKLTVELDALATRVLFDDNNKAIGVEYMKGASLYRASYNPSSGAGELKQVYVSREVILAGGAYNTPQLLMLSGVGPKDHLTQMGIPVRVDLQGVGSNLQDRYEVGVVNRMNFPAWWVLKGAKFAAGDPQYTQWNRPKREGAYITNGAVLSVIKRSFPERPLPDLYMFALLGLFRGYFPGYSKLFPEHLNYLTWAILKAHTKNTAGTVRLRSKDPRDVPEIDFHYFMEGNDTSGEDLKSVVEGIKYVRTLTKPLREQGYIAAEELPGPDVQTDEQIADFVTSHAWGHHASCSCPMLPQTEGGVVDKDFQVYGTKGLRIVDASVFPKIPGFFIVTSVYMIGEKAADVIAAAAGKKV